MDFYEEDNSRFQVCKKFKLVLVEVSGTVDQRYGDTVYGKYVQVSYKKIIKNSQ